MGGTGIDTLSCEVAYIVPFYQNVTAVVSWVRDSALQFVIITLHGASSECHYGMASATGALRRGGHWDQSEGFCAHRAK